MMKKTVVMAVIGAIAAGALVSGVTVAFAQADVIKARQDNRKATGPEMRAIKAIVEAASERIRKHPDFAALGAEL